MKNPEDPVWLEPMTPGLRVKQFTIGPRRTSGKGLKMICESDSMVDCPSICVVIEQ